jgi:diketogulonate reductase-like aldo/keto reductase
MINRIDQCTTLRNGVEMPWFGLGVWQVKDEDTLVQAVHAAVRAGTVPSTPPVPTRTKTW